MCQKIGEDSARYPTFFLIAIRNISLLFAIFAAVSTGDEGYVTATT
jgi:hypothetical protein